MQNTDQILLDRWIAGRDAQAFKSLTSKYCGMVYATCLRILRNSADAEEATQESFAALAAASSGPHGALGAWLHRVATYQALNRRRADGRRRDREAQFARTRARSTEIAWDDISQFVDQSIEALPDPLRAAIVAHFIEDETLTAIAKREGVTHSAISQRIQKGVGLIRDRMRQNGIPIATAVLVAMLERNTASAATIPGSLTSMLGKRALSGSSIAGKPRAAIKPTHWKAATAAATTVGAALVLLATFYAASPEPVTAASSEFAQPSATVTAAIAPVSTPEEFESAPMPAVSESAPATVADASPAPALTNWWDVVDAYAAHQDRIRRIRFDYEHLTRGDYYWDTPNGERIHREAFQGGSIVTDGERCAMKQYRWGDWFEGEPVPRDRPQFINSADDAYTYIQYTGGGGPWAGTPGSLQICADARNSPMRESGYREGRTYLLSCRYPGRLMLGFPVEQGRRLEELLYDARTIALRPEREVVDDAECYVIDADTEYGDFTVWFDPNRDFNVIKSIVDIGYGDINTSIGMLQGCSEQYEYNATKFSKVDGLWVPVESISYQLVQLLAGNGLKYSHQHKRKNIELLAPGEDDNAYVLDAEDIPEGARLMDDFGVIRRPGDPEWRWYGGQFVLTHEKPDGTFQPDPSTARGFGAGVIAGSVE